MTRDEYIIRMKNHDEEFDIIWQKIVDDTIMYTKANPDINMIDHQNDIMHMADNFAMSCAWLYDIINKTKTKNRTMRYKLRKALGFVYP